MSRIKAVWKSMRPNFLFLTFSMVLLAAALAMQGGGQWSWPLFSLVLIAALGLHAAVNWLNEYEDWQSGLDELTIKTPFSGGSGSLQRQPDAAEWVLAFGYAALGMSITIGAFFIWSRGWLLLPIGLVGIVLIISYTRWLTHSPWLCLIAPGLAFGPLMVLGSVWIFTGSIDNAAIIASLIPFFLVNNLLLLNQFPDFEADRLVGRFNILMHLGNQSAVLIFHYFIVAAFFILVISVTTGLLPLGAILGALGLLLAVPLSFGVQKRFNQLAQTPVLLAMNVAVNLLTPLLMALGLLIVEMGWIQL